MNDEQEIPTQTITPKFTTLLYDIREELGISWNEYVYLDMVHQLSRSGWCYKSLENVAVDMGMAKSGVVKMRDRLIHKQLVIKNPKGYVKSSVMYHKVVQRDTKSYHKVNGPYHKVVRSVPLSDTKSYNRITLDIKQQKTFNKYGIETLESAQRRISKQAPRQIKGL